MRLLHILLSVALFINTLNVIWHGSATLPLQGLLLWGSVATSKDEHFTCFNSNFKRGLRQGFTLALVFIATIAASALGMKAFGTPCSKIANMVVNKAQPEIRHMDMLASCDGISSNNRNELTQEIEVMLNAHSKLESIGSRTVCAGDLDENCFDRYKDALHNIEMRVLSMQRTRNALAYDTPEHTTTTTTTKAKGFTPSDNYEADIILLKGVKLISEGSEADLEKQYRKWYRIQLKASVCYNCNKNNKIYHSMRDDVLKDLVKKAFNIYWNARQNAKAKAKAEAKAKADSSHEELMEEMRRVEEETKALNEAFKTLDSIKL